MSINDVIGSLWKRKPAREPVHIVRIDPYEGPLNPPGTAVCAVMSNGCRTIV